jgi:hypothetical protein
MSYRQYQHFIVVFLKKHFIVACRQIAPLLVECSVKDKPVNKDMSVAIHIHSDFGSFHNGQCIIFLLLLREHVFSIVRFANNFTEKASRYDLAGAS